MVGQEQFVEEVVQVQAVIPQEPSVQRQVDQIVVIPVLKVLKAAVVVD